MSWIVTEAPDRQLGAEDASRWERVVKGSSRFKVEKQGGKIKRKPLGKGANEGDKW